MGDPPEFVVDGNVVGLSIDLRTYRLTAVKKAAYRLADRFTARIGSQAETELPVDLILRPGTSESGAHEAVRLFFQELLDQELREQVAEETAPLRALIMAHAFSRTGLIRDE